MDPNNRLADLITITGRLTELLRRENDALQNRRTKEVHELLDEKAIQHDGASGSPTRSGEADHAVPPLRAREAGCNPETSDRSSCHRSLPE